MRDQKILYSHGKKFLIHSSEKIGRFQILAKPSWPNVLPTISSFLSVGSQSNTVISSICAYVTFAITIIGHYLFGQLSLGKFGHYQI